MGMDIEAGDLLPGEKLALTKSVNAVVSLSEHGLSRFASGQLMWCVGMEGKEAIGGKLHLTDIRLVFKSHFFNRVSGKFSVFLPAVTSLKDTSFLLKRQMTVVTDLRRFDFVVWGVAGLIKEIEAMQRLLRPADSARIFDLAASHPDRVGTFAKSATAERINAVVGAAGSVLDPGDLVADRISSLAMLGYEELARKRKVGC
jgi:hypothetical protein